MDDLHQRLALVLRRIGERDPSRRPADTVDPADAAHDYRIRTCLIYRALALATDAEMVCGFGIDPNEPDWPVAYIELPTGQVSWHMPGYPGAYDLHSTSEKYERIAQFVEGIHSGQ